MQDLRYRRPQLILRGVFLAENIQYPMHGFVPLDLLA
jgi:hypothetical protein